MVNLFDVLTETNRRGNLSAVLNAMTSLYWTFEFVPPIMAGIYSLSSNDEWRGDASEPHLIASLAYRDLPSDKILEITEHDEVLYNSAFMNYKHKTSCLVTRDKGGELWIGYSGLDITSFTSIGAVGSLYYSDLASLGLKGKVITAFVPEPFILQEFEAMLGSAPEGVVHVVGHSMGSAMAVITGAYLAARHPDSTFRIHAYAPIAFYDAEFRDCVTELPNVELDSHLREDDVICKLFNTLKITDVDRYKLFTIDETCFPYTNERGEVKRQLPVRDLSLLECLNPMSYANHGLWYYDGGST